MARTKPNEAGISDRPWYPAFIREMDLVITQGELDSMRTGKTLYNTVIDERVGDFVRHLDEDYQPNFLGVIEVDPSTFKNYDDFPELTRNILGAPRGTWAVFKLNGKFDAMMSDGNGGFGTDSGHKFDKGFANGHSLNERAQYGALLSWIVYNRRNAISSLITKHSAQTANVEPGTIVESVHLAGKLWNKVEYLRELKDHYVGGSSAFELKGTRRGVKPAIIQVSESGLLHAFKIEPTMPPEYVAEDGIDRTISLSEKRQEAAQATYQADPLDQDQELRLGSRSPFQEDGDVFTREVLKGTVGDRELVGTYRIVFAPGSEVVEDNAFVPVDEPVAGFGR